MDDIFAQLKAIIAEKLDIDEAKIVPSASFQQDLGADSLDTYELVYEIEEKMGIHIPDDKTAQFETVQDACDYIKSQQEK